MKEKRKCWIDICKIIAMFLVIILHTVCNGIKENQKDFSLLIYYFGTFAIPLFFMVNGYLQLNKVKDYKYVLKKILNIFMVCIIWNIPIVIFKLVIEGESSNIISNVFLNYIQKGFFWQFWFLGALILIYIFLPLIQKLFNKTDKYKFITILLIIVSSLVDLFNIINNNFLGNDIIKNSIPQVFRIWTWLTYFFIGGLVRKNDPLKKVDNKKLIVITFVSLFVSVLYAYNFSNILYSNLYAENLYDSFIVIVTTFLIFNCFSRIQTSNKLITDIGKLNMGVYIIHPTIIKIFKYFNLLYNNYLNIIFSSIIFIICIIITKVISKIPYLNKIIKI